MVRGGLSILTASIFLAGEMAGSGVLALPYAILGTGMQQRQVDRQIDRYGRMDIWIDEMMDRWKKGQMEILKNGQMEGWIYGRMDRWKEGQIERRIDEIMNIWKDR